MLGSILRRVSLLLLATSLLRAEPLPWKRLEFKLDDLFSVRAKLEGGDRHHLEIATHLRWFLIDRVWHGDLWFEGKRALERVRIKLGQKGYKKVFRYGEEGVVRLLSKGGEEKERFFPKPEPFPCREVGDPYLLLYLLSLPELPDQLCVFNKEEYYRLAFRKEGQEEIEVEYKEGSRRVEARRLSEKIRVVPEPIGLPREAFEFLGIEGELLIWRDPEKGLIYRIEGKVPKFGRAAITLKRVAR